MSAYARLDMKYHPLKSWNVPITALKFIASRGGNSHCTISVTCTKISLFARNIISTIKEKLCEIKYIIIDARIVRIWDIKLEKKNTNPSNISSFKNVKISDQSTRVVIGMALSHKTPRNKSDWNITISKIVAEKPKNFPSTNSYLAIGFERIRNMVFHSISLKSSWLPTNKTQIIPKTSIIASPKLVITRASLPIVSCHNRSENAKKNKCKK